ncbi:hypothetical protein SAMN05421820_10365 [Pedobacter steynii]|uniref:Uncharacterized protein n=1 Tax=Pedobacter steynii TaxID=430522 RepID=A0A1G9QZA8_9SPHI|nr:hypothetical protein [Pedobacter steynii]NQX37933.1 hypothetical protein [Pedobacter steynii]SDM16358.1 hypothetical protein SAMN05421820_10365 [Pedobacter steynii]
MRIKLVLFFLACQTAVYAQNFKYPTLPNQGKSLSALVPANWKILDSISGDLNHDQLNDLAFVMEYHKEVRESRAYGDNTTEIITEIQKPRILAVYFKRANGEGYQIGVQNNNFILRSAEGGIMGDPLRPLKIDSNKLVLSFEGGGDWRWKLNYTFRYQDKNWFLEKAGNEYYNESSGEMTHKKYDFILRKRLVTTGKTHNRDAANETVSEDFPFKTLRTFQSFKKPWTWEIGPDEFL